MDTAPEERVVLALEAARRARPEAAFVEPIRVEPGRRNAVWRVSVAEGSAVLKVAGSGGLAVERAALLALDGLGCPRLLDGGEGWFLAADLGPSDPTGRGCDLAAIGAALGAIHDGTRGFSWHQPRVDVDHAIYRWQRGLRTLAASLSAAGVRLSERSMRDLGRVERILAHPGDDRVLANGDVGPANAIGADGRAKLVDWEVAGPRHPALDWYPAVQHRLRADPRPVSEVEEASFSEAYQRAGGRIDARGIAAAAVAWAAVAALTIPSRLASDAIQGTAGHRWRIATAVAEASRRSEGHFAGLARDLGLAGRLLGERWGVTVA